MTISTDSNRRFNYFAYLFSFYAFTATYIIPFKTEFPHAKIFLPLLSLVLLIQVVHFRTKFKVIDIVVLCCILITATLNFSFDLSTKFIAPIILVLLGFQDNNRIVLSRKYLSFLHWYAVPSIIYQLFTYRVSKDILISGEGSGRVALSVGDPNMSSLFMLVFFFFCYKNKFKVGMSLSILCIFLFSSRNYFLSMIIFLFMLIFEDKISKFFKHIHFTPVFLACNTFVLMLSAYWVNNVEAAVGYNLGVARLFSFNDLSNLRRFQANHFFLDSFIKDPGLALSGFKENYVPIFSSYDFDILHNSLFEITAVMGILLAPFYMYVILKTIHQYYQKDNLKYVYSYLFFCLFLHTSLAGSILSLLIFTLALPEYKPKSYENINHYSHI